jgi:hypothetical protein
MDRNVGIPLPGVSAFIGDLDLHHTSFPHENWDVTQTNLLDVMAFNLSIAGII